MPAPSRRGPAAGTLHIAHRLLLLLHATPASGWVLSNLCASWGKTNDAGYGKWNGGQCNELWPAFDLYETTYLWLRPEDGFSSDGLAAGITYAIHPNFCEDMIPHFPEESFETLDSLIGLSFLNCDRIRGAIAAALNTWAINHKRLHFEDVSEACWEGWESPATTECENAELFITTDLSYTGGLPANIPDFAAFVQNSKLGDSTVNPVETVLTTGTKPGFSMGLTRSQMTVSTNICWYLDTTFCYTFHWMNSGGVDVVLVMRIVVIVVCLICLFIIVGIIGAGLKNAICPKKANKAEKQVKQVFGRRSDAFLYFLARAPLFTLTFSFFWLIATPIFYFFVFLPCWDCFDFKATIAHEADFIELSPLPAGSDTIMYSQTKHRSRTCLTADDVEGLNFLYPSCDDDVGGAPMAEPKCLEALELSGYLRVTLALGGPFVLAAILMAMVQCCVSCYMARRSKNYEQAVSRLRRDASGLRKERSR